MTHEPFFSSKRELRLWLWTLAVVVAIYSTLGLASRLAVELPDDLAAAALLAGMFLVGWTVLTQGLRIRPGGAEVAVALGVTAVYLLVFLRMALPERSHLIEYSVVAVLAYEALTERAGGGRRVPVPAVLAVLVTSTLGAIDEGIQVFLPSRVFDPVDILFNVLAAGMAVAASVALGRARRWKLERSS